MSKRSLAVSFLTAGLTAGILAGTVGPAVAQGNPVGGSGNVYFLSGAVNHDGIAQKTFAFGDPTDEVYFGDWYGNGEDLPLVRRGSVFFKPNENNPNLTESVFAYGDNGDTVLIGDWDGDGDDSIAIRRGNHYFVKNDMEKTGKADSEFFYGEVNDKVLVGNWDGLVDDTATPGIDRNGDGDFTDKGTPATIADIPNRMPVAAVAGVDNTVPANGTFTDVAATPPVAGQPVDDVAPVAAVVGDPGYNGQPADGGDYTQPGDRKPGTGVDNNGDGDFTDVAMPAVPGDVAPIPGKGDTLMIQRGNEFFVKNSITTGVADYTFFYGDAGDTILVGDWATPATAKTGSTAATAAKPARSGDGADQLAVRRGNIYHTSTELEDARDNKKNPTASRVFAYGDVNDAVFVASLASLEVDEYGEPVDSDSGTPGLQQDKITGDGLGVRR